MISFLKYKTSQANSNAYFTYFLTEELSKHIKIYVNDVLLDGGSGVNRISGLKRKNHNKWEFWRGYDNLPLSNYSLQDSNDGVAFANRNNAFIMMFKRLYYQRSKKLITPTTLRKSFVTYLKRKGDEKILEDAAASMLHTKRIQDRYYSKLTSTERARNISNFMKNNLQ